MNDAWGERPTLASCVWERKTHSTSEKKKKSQWSNFPPSFVRTAKCLSRAAGELAMFENFQVTQACCCMRRGSAHCSRPRRPADPRSFPCGAASCPVLLRIFHFVVFYGSRRQRATTHLKHGRAAPQSVLAYTASLDLADYWYCVFVLVVQKGVRETDRVSPRQPCQKKTAGSNQSTRYCLLL